MKVGIQVPFQDDETVGIMVGDEISHKSKSQIIKGLVSPAEELDA